MVAKIKTTPGRSRHRRPHKPKGISDHAFKKVYWPYIPILLIITMLLGLSVQAGTPKTLLHHPSGSVLSYSTSMSLSGLLSDTNSARAKSGVAALHLDSKLDAAAQAKANDMAARNYWSHNTPEGNPPWTFVTAQNYAYQKLGENLAAGFDDEQATINGWMASPPHRENLLDPSFSEVGFGFANNPDYSSAGGGPMTIVVAFYGKPQVLAAHSQTPVLPSTTVKPTPIPQKKTAASSKTAAKAKPATQPKTEPKAKPATTQSSTKAAEIPLKSSRAQLVLANLPVAQFATSLTLIFAFSAIAIWLGRHALAVRRILVYGEAFAFRHPLMDIGLLIIAALSFLLNQTAGFIQ